MAKHQSGNQQNQIRNFSIIAHIDHGKTTLTDQFLKHTGTIAQGEKGERILDSNPIEKERGITIKLAPVTMSYKLQATSYKLNLIDTPGHVDFSYEVSRSLSACEAALLLVDATQGIQAQTLAHAKTSIDLGLTLLPAINKVDLPSARIEESLEQLREIFGFQTREVALISAKTGEGIAALIDRLIREFPKPVGNREGPLRALIFNSIFDPHLGVIAFVKVVDGSLSSEQTLRSLAQDSIIKVRELGIFTPARKALEKLTTGEVGYIATGLKDIRALKVGDTLTHAESESITPLPGFKIPKPVVFADVYPTQETNFNELNRAVEKLQLADAALSAKQIHSSALGIGLRLGFLGLFHSEITRERLKREYGVDTILTKPTVQYIVDTKDGKNLKIQHASELPDLSNIIKIWEPMVEVTLVSPNSYIGNLMELVQKRRGVYKNTTYIGDRAQLVYDLPLSLLISGFVDSIKSVSQGYASLDYRHINPAPVDALKLVVLVNHEKIDPLARIILRQNAQAAAKEIVTRLKQVLPRQLFAVPIQAAIGGKVIARETIPAARKDVTAKLYGGDRTRRIKLLQKQKKGKKKLAKLGKVTIPPEAFSQLMKL